MSNLDQIKDRINDLLDMDKTILADQVEYAYAIGVQDGLKQAQLNRIRAFEEEQQ